MFWLNWQFCAYVYTTGRVSFYPRFTFIHLSLTSGAVDVYSSVDKDEQTMVIYNFMQNMHAFQFSTSKKIRNNATEINNKMK